MQVYTRVFLCRAALILRFMFVMIAMCHPFFVCLLRQAVVLLDTLQAVIHDSLMTNSLAIAYSFEQYGICVLCEAIMHFTCSICGCYLGRQQDRVL